MNQKVWYYLTDEEGKAYQGVGADTVSISSEADVVDFRDAVYQENKAWLSGVSAVSLKVYSSREDITDSTKGPLDVDVSLKGMGKGRTTALYVVVPKKTAPTNSLSNLPAIKFATRKVSIELNGFNIESLCLKRREILESISDFLSIHRFVFLSSPAGSGKTSVLHLFQKSAKFKCIYLSPFSTIPATTNVLDLLLQAGIDFNAWSFPETGEPLIVMIDDAQFTYVNKCAWSSLFKTVAMWLPSSIKFIISATHVLKSCAESPVEFEWLPTLNRQRFLLSDAEARQFLDSEIGLRSDMKYESLIQCIILQCGGLIGALRLSVDSLTAEFKESYHPSENECLLYCLSADALSQMTHVFGSAHSFPIDARFRNFLASCFTSGLTAAPPILESNDAISLFNLQKAGILVERNGLIGFSSPLAQQYYIQWLFPYRSSTPPESLHALLKSCIQNFSPSLLAQSAVDGFPKEATFQHLLMEGLAKFTPPGCAICPDLLKVCPGEIQTGGCLFYLNGSLRWGIELLVLGRDIGSHINRFGDAGNYSKLAVKDFAVLDFRVSSDGEPTNVERHVKRVSVFFKAGDFSQCKCIFGLKEDVVLLNLNM